MQRQRNDAADAATICEAAGQPRMRNVPIKSEKQQGVPVLHRARDLLTRQRTMIINAIRAHLAEFGIVAAQGPHHVAELIAQLEREQSSAVPESHGKPYKTLYNRWKRWGEVGVFVRMMEGLATAGAEPTTVMIDATYLKAHRTASSLRLKKGISDA